MLKNVTLVAVATTEVEETIKAIEYSVKDLKFEKVLFFSHYNPCPDNRVYDFVQVNPFSDVGDWGRFIVFDLHQYIETDYIILIHSDGFIVNPQCWTNQFLEYDYIGAPWPLPKDSFSYRDSFGNIIRMGNSVSLRSRRMLALPSELNLDWRSADHGFFHEDGFLCVQNRHVLQQHGMKFAPLSVACHFSREKTLPENKDIEPFAFHKWEKKNRKYPCFSSKNRFWAKLKRWWNKVRK